jgi:hypothetical protein
MCEFRTFPKALRHKWLKLLRHHKVKLAISSSTGRVTLDGAAEQTAPVRPYPRGSKTKAASKAEKEKETLHDSGEHTYPA